MSLYTDASIITTPNGFKAGKLYSLKPTDGSGDLDVVRATTATRVNSDGLIETVGVNVPRLDYSNGSCPSILVEPQRTNLVAYSEDFGNAYWELGSVASITTNTTISPDGTQNADTLTANGTGGLFVRKNTYLGTTQNCSSSIFAKKNNNRYVGLRNSGANSQHDVFDFDTKTWTNNSGASLSYDELSNGWFRLKSVNTDAVNLNYYWSVIPAVNTSGFESTTASNLSVYIWGGQAEQNASYPTSYIPTVASTVTRNADVISKTGISSLIGQTEGTIFLDYNLLNFSNQEIFINNNYVNSIALGFLFDAGTFRFRCLIFSNSTGTIFSSGSISTLGNYKTLMKYKSGENKLFINGILIASGISTLNFTTSLSSLFLNANNAVFYGNNSKSLKNLSIYKTALTDAECIALTTL